MDEIQIKAILAYRPNENRVLRSWLTKANYPALVISIRGGEHNNGYVGVDPSHVLFDNSYSKNHAALGSEDFSSPEDEITVHGGVTYTGYLSYLVPTGPHNIWWFGFDCAHFGDLIRSPLFSNLGMGDSLSFKDENYVSNECENLAKQLKEIDESIIDSFLTGIGKNEV